MSAMVDSFRHDDICDLRPYADLNPRITSIASLEFGPEISYQASEKIVTGVTLLGNCILNDPCSRLAYS
jgi:hypothetical protein